MFNPYEHMKSRMKKEYDGTEHWYNLYNVLLSMFEYTGLPETLHPELIETMFITQGTCGVAKINGDLYTGCGGYCGNVVNYLPENYKITVQGIAKPNFEGKAGVDIAVGWNNGAIVGDFSLLKFASILTEIDVSERVNVLFSRFLRIPKVKNTKEQKAVEDAVTDILLGNFRAVVSDNIRELLTDTATSDNFLDLVDVKEVDKLQYLNQYRDNIIKRFFQMYGQGMQSTAKLAQQTTDELHGNDTVSMILPVQRLHYRKKFVDEINRLFGTSITVDFSECWKNSENEMLTENEMKEGENDVEENDSEQPDQNDDGGNV